MGLSISTLLDRFFTHETRVLMLGLDGAGKTTLLYKLKLNELVHTVPTIGFNVEQVQYKKLSMSIWDVGGQDKIRRLWTHYYHGTDALIFVVDANDGDRLREARDELHAVLRNDELRDAVVLVYANKMDLPNAVHTSGMAQVLDLLKVRNSWYVQEASAMTGDGVYEGLEWMEKSLRAARNKK